MVSCQKSFSPLSENVCVKGPLLQIHVMDMFDEESGGRTDIPGWFFKQTISAVQKYTISTYSGLPESERGNKKGKKKGILI